MLSVLIILFFSAIVSCGTPPEIEKHHVPIDILKNKLKKKYRFNTTISIFIRIRD